MVFGALDELNIVRSLFHPAAALPRCRLAVEWEVLIDHQWSRPAALPSLSPARRVSDHTLDENASKNVVDREEFNDKLRSAFRFVQQISFPFERRNASRIARVRVACAIIMQEWSDRLHLTSQFKSFKNLAGCA